MTKVEYDALVAEIEKCGSTLQEPRWVVARDLETAEAFAQWCVDNGIEEPEIAIVQL